MRQKSTGAVCVLVRERKIVCVRERVCVIDNERSCVFE